MDISLRTTPPYLLLSHKISQHHRHYLPVKSSTSLSFPTNLNTYGPSRFSSTRPRPLTISTLSTSRARGIASAQLIGEDTTSKLDEVQVFGLDGKPIVISDLWKDRKAVVAFARHFGCVLCRKRADYLASAKDKMDAAGVALVLIGPGSVDQAKAFSEQTKFKGEVYADPSYSSYEALSFVSGISTTFTPKAGLKIIQSYMEGYRQDWGLSFEKDTRTRGGWQQGGIIVAGPGKSNISYVHKAKATKAKGTTLTRQKPNFAPTFVGRVRFECSLIGWSDSRGVRRGVAQSGKHICFGYRGP